MRKVLKIIIIILIILSVYLVISKNESLSKYSQIISGEGVGEIAYPILHIQSDDKILVNKIRVKKKLFFSVNNFEGDKISSINMLYALEFISTLDNVKINLYKNDQRIELVDNKTSFMNINGNVASTDNYVATIEYDGIVSSNINGDIKLKIYGEQKI